MKRFQFLYFLLLISDIVLGNQYLTGFVTLRYVIIVALVLICYKEHFSFPKRYYLTGYFVFILFFGLTSLLNGYFLDFTKNFITYFMDSIVWIWATYVLVKKYSTPQVLVYALLTIGVVNGIVTIGQHYLNPIAFGIAERLNLIDVGITNSISEKSDTIVSEFCLYGVLGAVPNGYFSAVFCVLCLYLYQRFKRVLYLLLYPFFLFSLYCVQERAALVAGVLFSVCYLTFYIYKNLSPSKKILYTLIFVILGFYLVSNTINIDTLLEGSRYESFELGSRSNIYNKASEYILNNLLTANMFDFFYTYQLYPHNLFYNAYIYGALIGGTLILIILFLLLKKAFLKVIKSDSFSPTTIVFCYSIFAYTIVSLTHNASIVTGDVLFWILIIPIVESEDFISKVQYET